MSIIPINTRGYDSLMFCGFRHLSADHSSRFARGKVHINGLEGFWNWMKERLFELAKKRHKRVSIHLLGQELQPETYAVCGADMKNRIMAAKPQYAGKGGDCIVIDRIFNLITKSKYWGKTTLDSLTDAAGKMKEYAVNNDIKKIAVPTIGCGLVGLQWSEVSAMIQRVF